MYNSSATSFPLFILLPMRSESYSAPASLRQGHVVQDQESSRCKSTGSSLCHHEQDSADVGQHFWVSEPTWHVQILLRLHCFSWGKNSRKASSDQRSK